MPRRSRGGKQRTILLRELAADKGQRAVRRDQCGHRSTGTQTDLLLPASLRAAGWDAVPGMRRAELAVTIVALNLSARFGLN